MLRASASMLGGIVAEKSSVCALLRERRDDAAHVVDEAHVEHAVGLVEDEVRDAVEAHEPCCMRSSRRPGVATSMSGAARSAISCRCWLTPP